MYGGHTAVHQFGQAGTYIYAMDPVIVHTQELRILIYGMWLDVVGQVYTPSLRRLGYTTVAASLHLHTCNTRQQVSEQDIAERFAMGFSEDCCLLHAITALIDLSSHSPHSLRSWHHEWDDWQRPYANPAPRRTAPLP